MSGMRNCQVPASERDLWDSYFSDTVRQYGFPARAQTTTRLSHNATRTLSIAAKCVRLGFAHTAAGFRSVQGPAEQLDRGPGGKTRAARKADETSSQSDFFLWQTQSRAPQNRPPKTHFCPAESARYACRAESYRMWICIKMFLSSDLSPKNERNTRRVTATEPTPDRPFAINSS
jgi:hypothetical protein